MTPANGVSQKNYLRFFNIVKRYHLNKHDESIILSFVVSFYTPQFLIFFIIENIE